MIYLYIYNLLKMIYLVFMSFRNESRIIRDSSNEMDECTYVFEFQLEEKILEITTSKDKEIKIRDEKLTRLKNQMADALKGNSW